MPTEDSVFPSDTGLITAAKMLVLGVRQITPLIFQGPKQLRRDTRKHSQMALTTSNLTPIPTRFVIPVEPVCMHVQLLSSV